MPGHHSGLRASVLLATTGRPQLLPAVLAPLLADSAASEIVVVVDGCREGSVELLSAVAGHNERVKTIFVTGGGVARALLTGALQASGDVLVILEDDEIVDHAGVAGHLGHHAEEGGLVVVGYVEHERAPVRGPRELRRRLQARHYQRDVSRYADEPSSIVRQPQGGYLSVQRRDYLRVTPRSPGLRSPASPYHELGARCLAAGMRAVFDPSLRARRLNSHGKGVLPEVRNAGVLGAPASLAPRAVSPPESAR